MRRSIDLDLDPGMPAGERVQPQEQEAPHHIGRERRPLAAGMAAHQRELEGAGLFGRDDLIGKEAEAGGDPVDGSSRGHGALNDPPGRRDRLPGLRRNGNGAPVADDGEELVERERPAVDGERLRHGEAPRSAPAVQVKRVRL